MGADATATTAEQHIVSREDRISPRAANRFLEWFCRSELDEEVRGDLEEAYFADVKRRGAVKARLSYWAEVILFIRSHTIRRRDRATTRGSVMWKNYITVAMRSLRKQKSYSAINLVGLAVGLGCTFLIMMFVADEHSYDLYYTDADRIYRMVGANSGGYDGIAKVNGAWGVNAAEQIPSIEAVARFMFFGQARFQIDDRKEYVYGGLYADSTTFDVFSWDVLVGDPATALIEPRSLVLTKSVAESWFGTEDPRGQHILLDGQDEYTVTAVMEDVPLNSHFTFNFLASMSGYTGERHDDWVTWNQYYTYFKLYPDADVEAITDASTEMLADNMTAEQAMAFGEVRLQPLKDIYLRSNMFREISLMGNQKSVTVFMLMAIFILLIAAVNFINLSTARSSLRAREVGVRKSLGARRGKLIGQFLSESIVTVFIASIIGLGLVVLFLTPFNEMAGKTFTLSALFTPSVVLWTLITLVGVGLIAGIYPAFVLSSFSPARVIKGAVTAKGAVGFRKGLVALQFVISAALILGTGIVSDQLEYIQERPLGFDRENILGIPFQDNGLQPNYYAIRDEMASVPGVEGIAISANRPGGSDYGIPIEIPGLTRIQTPPARMLVADLDFVDVYRMKMASGRDFDADRPADKETGLLINEEMARMLKWDDPIGKRITMPAIDREFEVIGVLQDFHYRSLHESIAPLILFMAPDEWYSRLNVRINPANMDETIAALGAIYERYDVNNTFSYSFMDQMLDTLYSEDRRTEELLNVFTFLAIMIACLGLFGLAAFTAERRKAEIGVRKVLGASEMGIIMLLTKETATLVSIALVIAIPAALYFGTDWLESYAYAGEIDVLTLVLGSLMAMALAIAATGAQAWRASRLDPVKAIRVD